MTEININYLAILVMGVVSFLLGALWYSPLLFSKAWVASVDKSEEDLKKGTGTSTYIITLITWLIASFVLSNVINLAQANTVGTGVMIGFMCWFGFFAATTLMLHLFAVRPIKLWLIDSSYILAAFIISGAVFAVWK